MKNAKYLEIMCSLKIGPKTQVHPKFWKDQAMTTKAK